MVSMSYGSRILRFLGEADADVISRLFDLLIAALAVQIIVDGIRASFAE